MQILGTLLLVLASTAGAEHYTAATLHDGGKTLTITSASGSVQAPLTEDDQQAFGQARISADGRTVGWLAQVGNCCTSYPLPLALVLFRDGKVLYRFHETSAIFHWTFLSDGGEVAYQWTFPHGFVPTYYVRRSLADGAVRGEFVCEIDENAGTYVVPKRIPDWVHSVAQGEACSGTGK